MERTDYVIVGIKLDPDDVPDDVKERLSNTYEDNPYRQESTEHDGLTSITDGMSGNYLFIGKVVEKALIDDGGVLEVTECDSFELVKADVKRAISRHFPEYTSDPRVYAFTHCH